jgi:hypothetical protein
MKVLLLATTTLSALSTTGQGLRTTSSFNTTTNDEVCHAVSPGVTNQWCDNNCNASPPNCPPTLCACDGAPTPAPPPATPTPAPPPAEGGRVIGYIENWGWGNKLPTPASLAPLTDIIMAFAVTYNGNAAASSCAAKQCAAAADPLSYSNAAVNSLAKSAAYLKTAGLMEDGQGAAAAPPRRVLLSIGGWNMGHCTRDATTGQYTVCQGPADREDVVNCWDYCFPDPTGFAAQLVALARGNGFDGVDLDYEGPDASLSAAEQDFVARTTAALRAQWPAAVISHTLMEIYMENTASAVALTKRVAADIDYVSIQFYNFGPAPLAQTAALVAVTRALADGAFGGDPSKVVAGLTISEANSDSYFVPTGKDACTIVRALQQNFTAAAGGIGGIMLWESRTDADGAWAGAVKSCLAN